MAHILKDSMNHYAIEVSRGPKYVNVILRTGGEIECRKFLHKTPITDHEYHSETGQHMFDERWQRPDHGDRTQPDPDHSRLKAELTDLHRVIDSFLSGMLPVTDRARRMLERLRIDPGATEVPTDPETSTTNEGDTQMATKTKTKKAKVKFSAETKIKLIAEKKFHEGSVRGKCFAVIQKHKELTVAEYLKHCSGREIKKAQALSCLAKLSESNQKTQTVQVG